MSCGPTPSYEETVTLDPQGWITAERAEFSVDIQDNKDPYELRLTIEHDRSYRYENIYLQIETLFPDREARKELLPVDLADKKGKWLGECGSDRCEATVPLLNKFKFPAPGSYGFKLGQYTRDEALKGIHSLTMELYPKEGS